MSATLKRGWKDLIWGSELCQTCCSYHSSQTDVLMEPKLLPALADRNRLGTGWQS